MPPPGHFYTVFKVYKVSAPRPTLVSTATSQAHLGLKLSTIQLTIYNTAVASTSACHSLCCLCLDVWMPTWDCAEQWKVYEVTQYVIVSLGSLLWFPLGCARDNFVTNGDLALSLCCVTTLKCHLPSCHPASPTPALSPNIFMLNSHNDHRAGAGVDIVREYEVRLGSLQIQMKFYLEKMKLR